MIAAVIDYVLYHVPEDRRTRIAAHELVFESAVDSFGAKLPHKGTNISFQVAPRCAQRSDIGKCLSWQKSLWRIAAPTRVPNQLRGENVNNGVANGFEAAVQRLRKLLRSHRLQGIEHAIARPIMVVQQSGEIF